MTYFRAIILQKPDNGSGSVCCQGTLKSPERQAGYSRRCFAKTVLQPHQALGVPAAWWKAHPMITWKGKCVLLVLGPQMWCPGRWAQVKLLVSSARRDHEGPVPPFPMTELLNFYSTKTDSCGAQEVVACSWAAGGLEPNPQHPWRNGTYWCVPVTPELEYKDRVSLRLALPESERPRFSENLSQNIKGRHSTLTSVYAHTWKCTHPSHVHNTHKIHYWNSTVYPRNNTIPMC